MMRRTPASLIALAFGTALALAPAHGEDLYRAATHRSLVADRRAAFPGDIVTVLVYENSTASSSADTSTNTSFGLEGSVTTMADTHRAPKAQLGDSYGGRGQIQREGRLLAQLSTTVTKVWPNGDLSISGEQTININGEKTRIRLSGKVRTVDVSQANTVLSNRLADAQIDYVGDGYVTERTKPGLIPRVMAWLGLW
jgi:flagellar L-ring protein precursor FlgH